MPTETELLSAFDEYLQNVRGLQQNTRTGYRRSLKSFLEWKFGASTVDVSKISGNDLKSYISTFIQRGKWQGGRAAAAALRSFLRYLVVVGECDCSLPSTVPTPKSYRHTHIPVVFSDEQLTRFLSSFDPSRRTGLRDYAIAQCLLRLGLRAHEVAALSLDDIDWRASTIVIQAGKNRQASSLPMPAEMGKALAAYLKDGRPATAERKVFVCLRNGGGSSMGRPITARTVRELIFRAWKRTDLNVPTRGTHALRHSFASHMLRGGAGLKMIADFLRHRSLDTTFIYTKVDLTGLSQVAMPWPEVEP